MGTTLEVSVKLRKDEGDLLLDPNMYKRLAGSLIYVTIIGPNISYVVNLMSQFITNPRHLHLATIKQIIRYLLGTHTHDLFF